MGRPYSGREQRDFINSIRGVRAKYAGDRRSDRPSKGFRGASQRDPSPRRLDRLLGQRPATLYITFHPYFITFIPHLPTLELSMARSIQPLCAALHWHAGGLPANRLQPAAHARHPVIDHGLLGVGSGLPDGQFPSGFQVRANAGVLLEQHPALRRARAGRWARGGGRPRISRRYMQISPPALPQLRTLKWRVTMSRWWSLGMSSKSVTAGSLPCTKGPSGLPCGVCGARQGCTGWVRMRERACS